ncbi:MAG: hypothetical protein J6S78_02745 [Lachnospiraceae bacterium]|nr:hypothetical protein [Lachnospiraceae bacterium]
MRKKKQEKLEQKSQKKAARKKKIILGIVGLLAVLVIIGLIFWFSPRYFLKGVKADSVSKITVFDGTNGKKFDIDSSHNVKLIVETFRIRRCAAAESQSAIRDFNTTSVSMMKTGRKSYLR